MYIKYIFMSRHLILKSKIMNDDLGNISMKTIILTKYSHFQSIILLDKSTKVYEVKK